MEAGAKVRTYKIGQAAKLLDVKPFVLRFWETEFRDVLVPVRTQSGQRAYTEGNVSLVREIKRLLYDEGLTIEGAKKRLQQPQKSAPASAVALRTGPRPEPPPSPKPDLLAYSQPGAESGSRLGEDCGDQASDQASRQAKDQAEALAAALAAAQETAQESARAAAKHAARSKALCATLADVAGELRALRDLLG